MAGPDWDWYAEAERRGLLQGEDKSWYEEAKRRGLAPGVAPAQEPPPEPMTGGDVATDVGKSFGVGVGQGLLGLATLPGTVDTLGRRAVNKVGRWLGVSQDIMAPNSYFWDYGRAKQNIEDNYTGKFYEPKSLPGEYARTAGEMSTAALGPGSVARRITSVAAPAFASETAGQLTKGTAAEPYARLAGGIVGAYAPQALSAAITPQATSTSAARRAVEPHIANLERNGVRSLTAGQRTGSKKWQHREEVTRHTPLGPNTYDNMARDASHEFTRAAWRNAGLDLPDVSPNSMRQAIAHFEDRYTNLAQNARVNASQGLVDRLERVVRDYFNNTGAGDRRPLIQSTVDEIRNRVRAAQVSGGQNATALGGEAYRAFYSRLREQHQKYLKAGPARQEEAQALGDILEHLNTAMVSSAPRNMQGALRREMTQLNRDYYNFKLIEKANEGATGEWAAQGLLSPSRLKGAVIRRNGRNYTAGRTPMGRLARSGEAVMRPLPSSGTGERQAAREWMDGTNTKSFLSGGAGVLATGDPITGAAIAGVVRSIPTLKSHALMSSPVQRWLSNNRIPERWPQAGAEFQGAFAPQTLWGDEEEQR